MGVPVADNETAKAHTLFQDIGKQAFMAGDFLAVPAGKAGHDGLHAGIDRRNIRRAVDIPQFYLADSRVALVAALKGAAVSQKMFGAGQHMRPVQNGLVARRALQALDKTPDIAGDQRRVLGIALIGAAPAAVLRHGDGRRKGPFHSGGPQFQCRCLGDSLQ